jgi:hypothetical protein
MGPEDLIGHINEHGLKEKGQGSEYVCNKARDLCVSDKIPLDDITLVITHLKIDANE